MAEPIQRKTMGRKFPHDITVTLDDRQREQILEICENMGLAKTEVFRLALQLFYSVPYHWKKKDRS